MIRSLPAILRRLRPWLVPLLVVGVGYVVYEVMVQAAQVHSSLRQWRWDAWALGVAAAVLTSGVRAMYRLSLYRLAGYPAPVLPSGLALRSYAWGQVLRYIPGKVAGPATEAVLLQRHVPVSALVRVTLFEAAAMLLLAAAWLAASFLLLSGWMFLSAVAFLLAIAGMIALHAARPYLRAHGESQAMGPAPGALACTAWLVLEWIAYYLVWMAISPREWFRVSSVYAAASMAGTVVFVAPAGFGVREAAYTLMAPWVSDASSAMLLTQALVARVLFSIGDLLLPLLLATMRWVRDED